MQVRFVRICRELVSKIYGGLLHRHDVFDGALVDVPVAVIHSEPEQCPPASVTSNGCVGLLRLRLFIDIFSYCAAALDFRSMAPRS
jgi:hypothetical protein